MIIMNRTISRFKANSLKKLFSIKNRNYEKKKSILSNYIMKSNEDNLFKNIDVRMIIKKIFKRNPITSIISAIVSFLIFDLIWCRIFSYNNFKNSELKTLFKKIIPEILNKQNLYVINYECIYI